MAGKRVGASSERFASGSDLDGNLRRSLRQASREATTLVLDLLLIKPIAIFVWWFSRQGNELDFRGRRELLDVMERAMADGRPVLIASNHVSWFDDPVIPMALYRTGQRAALEFVALAGLVVACAWLPSDVLPPPLGLVVTLGAAVAVARQGARKIWWTLGDRVNLSNASVLEGKLALTRKAPPGRFQRALLRIADRAIPWFMRSGATKTIFVERSPGEAAKRARAGTIGTALERAARLEPVWVFYEGGRARVPGVIAPARRGIGSLALGLRDRGYDPLVVVVFHRGMERLIPPGGSRFLAFGNRVEVDWSLFAVDPASAAGSDAQAFADAVRATAINLQRTRESEPASGA